MRARIRPLGGGDEDHLRWATIIKSEMDTWVPERLPERFRPRPWPSEHMVCRALRAAWRPVAVAGTIALAGCAVYSQLPPRATVPAVVRTFLGTPIRITPTATPAATTWPAHRVPAGLPAAPGRSRVPSAPLTPTAQAQPRLPSVAIAATPLSGVPAPSGSPSPDCVDLFCVVR
jgi:hypothetical protein